MLNKHNQKNLKRLIRFFSGKGENGYIFAYADKTAQIKGINATIQQHFEQSKQKIGIFFYNKYQDVTLIEQLKIFNKEHKYQGIIVANLYEPISDTEHARRNITEINFAREQFHALDTPIIFWITQEIYPQLINKANDLYSQRRLPSIVFEAEQDVTQQQDSIKYNAHEDTQDQVAKTSTKLKIVEQQFQKALTLNLSDKELVNDYLIDYLLELSKHHHKQNVLTLYQKHQNTIKPLIEKNSQQLGKIFDNIHNYSKALEFYSLYIKAQKFNHLQLALTLITRSDVYRVIGELKAALKDAEKAKEIMLELCLQSPKNKEYTYTLGMAQSRLGNLHKDLGNLSQALQFFEDDLKLTKELFEDNPNNVGFKNGLAICYEKLGVTHKDLGNLSQALQFFEDDLKLTKELFEDNPNNVSFKNGLAISYSKLGDIHKDLGNLSQALEFFQFFLKLIKELFEENPNNVTFKNGLAVSYFNLGEIEQSLAEDSKQMLNYFILSRDLLIELNQQHPDYVEFKKNLDEVDDILKGLQ